MQFIIHSKQLCGQAERYEESLGKRCYIPGRDTRQADGTQILRQNLRAMKRCEQDVPVFWDGGSLGTMFDMGMAYALGKRILPKELVSGRNWIEYFGSKIGQCISCEDDL